MILWDSKDVLMQNLRKSVVLKYAIDYIYEWKLPAIELGFF